MTLSNNLKKTLHHLQKAEEVKLIQLEDTINLLDKVLGSENYLLLNTYKSYPYATHDVDIVVKNFKKTTDMLQAAGLTLVKELLPGIHYSKKGLLLVDIFEDIEWGSIKAVDDDVMWLGRRKVKIGDANVRLPSFEGDILSIAAHTNFQFYKITLSDLIYIYKLMPDTNWPLVIQQASSHGWLDGLVGTISILNYFHFKLYGEPSLIEKYISSVQETSMEFPYIYSYSHVAKTLRKQGFLNLVRLFSYTADRLSLSSWAFYNAYCHVVMDKISKIWVSYIHY